MFDLSKIPKRKKDLFAWADYWELRCIADVDGTTSSSDFADSISEGQEFNDDTELYGDEKEDSHAELSDKIETITKDVIVILHARSVLFGDQYPFVIESEKLEVKSELLESHVAYIVLLICSNAQKLSGIEFKKIYDGFEEIAHGYLKSLLGENGHSFLVSSQNKDIGTTAIERLTWVATKLGTKFIGREEDFAGNTMGEKGLDVFGWIEMGDTLVNRPIFLIQATCQSSNLDKKASEVSPSRWTHILSFTNPPIAVLCIPHSYRNSVSDFADNVTVSETIFIDRSRILKQLPNFQKSLKPCTYKNYVDIINLLNMNVGKLVLSREVN